MVTLLLWAIMLLYCFNCAGYLHNIVVSVPNWSSGEVKDVMAYRNSQTRTKNSLYFGPIIIATILVSIIALILVWNKNELLRLLVAADLVIITGNFITTFTIFVPIVNYIEKTQPYEPHTLKKLVKKWVFFNQIRFISILTGLIISIAAVNYHVFSIV